MRELHKSTNVREKFQSNAKKPVRMEKKAMVQVLSLSAKKKAPLEEKINHGITNECLSIFSKNGSKVKVQKYKLIQMLNWKETHDCQLRTYISIVGGGFLWRLAAPSTEDRENNHGFPLRGRVTHQSYLT